jgi:N-acetylneuraminic acid mutarotase
VSTLSNTDAPNTAGRLTSPDSGTWTFTGSLNTGRGLATATLLPNGKVLVAGGYNSYGGYLASAELDDPVTGTWTATGSLNTGRYAHTATLLSNGKVLVAGGFNNISLSGILSSAELYDPATGRWNATASLSTARELHTAKLLPIGKVLVAGGTNRCASPASFAEPLFSSWTATCLRISLPASQMKAKQSRRLQPGSL